MLFGDSIKLWSSQLRLLRLSWAELDMVMTDRVFMNDWDDINISDSLRDAQWCSIAVLINEPSAVLINKPSAVLINEPSAYIVDD